MEDRTFSDQGVPTTGDLNSGKEFSEKPGHDEVEGSLFPHHLAMLKEGSGITSQVITARGYRTINNVEEMRELGFSRHQWNVPGLLLPVHTTDGRNSIYVYRPDVPRVVENRRKRNPDGSFHNRVIKYEIPKNSGVRIDCPPVCHSMLTDPSVPLWITEGQKKGDALASRGLCAIALLGVWNFKGKNEFGGVTLLADFDYIALNSRDVRIVFDSDVMLKPEVRNALERLSEHLKRKGAHVSAAYLPSDKGQKIGVDDYLLNHTVEDLEWLIESARLIPQPAQPMVELLDAPPFEQRRPLALIDGQAYAAIWPHVRVTVTETVDREGNIVKYEQPVVTTARRLFIVRGDGVTFGEGAREPMEKLGIDVRLPEVPPQDKLWSTPGVKAYVQGERPDPPGVFHRIVDVVNRFIDFDHSLASQRVMSELIACYIIASWMLDAFNVIGFLWPNGERGSGKTQLLTIVSELGYLGQMILAGGSYASLRDLADYGATLCFDDAENLSDPRRMDPDKRALLLAGNRRGNTVPVKEPGPDRTWHTRHVNTFCPRTFSAIQLPDPVLASRTIIIPLVRTPDRFRANADVLDYSLWPHDKRKLVDDLWALSLTNLPDLPSYASLINDRAQLTGRNLEPWRAILAVAAWLEDKGVSGLLQRMEQLSLDYQQERRDLESKDLTALVIRAICICLGCEVVKLSEVSEVSSEAMETSFIKTAEIVDEIKRIVEDEETDINPEQVNSRKIGRLLKKLRFEKSREGGTGKSGWRTTRGQLKRWIVSLGLNVARETSQTSQPHKSNPMPSEAVLSSNREGSVSDGSNGA